MSIVEIVRSGARQEVNHVVEFATRPVGVFETVDKMIRTARSTARSVVEQTGVRAPGILQKFRLLQRY